MRSRKTRLAVIIDILTHHNIGCQDELSKQLASRGFIVTQATLSRDLKKLRSTKVANDMGGYRYVVASPETENPEYPAGHALKDTIQSALHPAAISLNISGNIVVIKTRNGYASGLAYDLDIMNSPLVLGTIPGADTVCVIIDENASRGDIFNLFIDFLPPEVLEEAHDRFFPCHKTPK